MSFISLAFFAACTGGPSGDQHLDIVFDVCRPIAVTAPSATASQLESIEQALALWRDRGVTALALGAPAGADLPVEIRFTEAALAFHGVYEDEIGVIFVNDGLEDPEDRAITIAHELGHAFGLWHIATSERTSVMNPGNMSTLPTDGDELALQSLWGPCPTVADELSR